MRILLVYLLAAMGLSAQFPNADTEKRNPFAGDPEAIEAGRQTFVETCSACHGVNGEGGRGPSLVGPFVRRLSDQQLFNSVQKGVPGTDMPPFPLADDKIWRVSAFVRSLSEPAIANNVPGDVMAGHRLFYGKAHCSQCHMYLGQGGFLGPDLSDAGARNTLAQLREAILHPNARIADGFEAVTLKTRDGQYIKAIAKYRTNYAMYVLDGIGRMHAIRGQDMDRVTLEEKSWMPDNYDKYLTQAEFQDLLVFLSCLSTRSSCSATWRIHGRRNE